MSSVQKNDELFDVTTSEREGYPRFGKGTRQKLTEEETSQLLSLTALSLSAFNVNNCRLVVVRDLYLRKQISKFSSNPSQIPHLASLIILCADMAQEEKRPGSNGGNGTEGAVEGTASPQKTSRRASDIRHRDEAMCSCGIAAQTLMLTAKAMGYDSWRLEGFDSEGVGTLINLPQDHVVAMLIVVGKNMKNSWHQVSQPNFQDVVVLDQF